MSTKWIRYSKRSNPCPVCAGSKECRGFQRDDGKLQVHCRGKVSAPAGWGFLGDDRHGFAKFVEGWDDRSERDWDAIARQRAEREARETQERATRSTAADRDRFYRAIQDRQRLSTAHRKELHRRGLDDAQIDLVERLGWLRAWRRGLHWFAPANIPGAARGQTTGTEGMAIALPDIDGAIAGFQIKPETPREDGAKYVWLAGCQLPNGEMPLGIYQHPDRPRDIRPRVWVTEGTLKPMVTALKAWAAGHLDVIVLGVGGCSWASHPKQIKGAIAQLDPSEIILLPDAGWTKNENVQRQVEALAALVPALTVADWGQWERAKADRLDPDNVPTEAILGAAKRAWGAIPTITPAETVLVARDGQAAATMTLIGTQLHIWNRGGTGSGKSRSAAAIAREFLDQSPNGRVLYVTARPDDISDPAVADTFARMVVRSPENCTKSHLFNGLGDKGYGEVRSEAKGNPICQGCKMAAACTQAAGYFRHDRRTFLETERAIALHPQSLSPGLFEDAKGNPIPVLAIWEEAGELAPLVESLAFDLRDFDRAMGDLEADYPELHTTLGPLRSALRPLLKGEGTGYYGVDTIGLKERLGTLTVTPEMLEAARGYETALSQQLAAALSEEADGVEISKIEAGKGAKRQLHRLNAALEHHQTREKESAIEDAIARWLVMLLQAIADDRSAITVDRWGKCTISRPNRRLVELAGLAVSNVYLDATADPLHLATVFGFGDGDFAAIDVEPIGPGATVKVTQITGLGKCGAQRSDELQQRIEGAIAALNPDGDAAVFDLKKFSVEVDPETGEKALRQDRGGYWFVHTRGSNEYQSTKRIISVGCACPSLHALKADYAALSGLKPEGKAFERYVQERIWAQLRQFRGRLRETLRPGEELELILITDAMMPPDWATEAVPVATLDRALASKGDATKATVLQTMADAIAQGVQPTIDAIANAAQVTKGRVSQIANDLADGGFRAVRESLAGLYSSSIEKLNFWELPPEWQRIRDEMHRLGVALIGGEMHPTDAAIAAASLVAEVGQVAYDAAIEALPEPIKSIARRVSYRAGDRVWRLIDGDWQPYQLTEQPTGCPGWRCHHIDRPGDVVYAPIDRLAPAIA